MYEEMKTSRNGEGSNSNWFFKNLLNLADTAISSVSASPHSLLFCIVVSHKGGQRRTE